MVQPIVTAENVITTDTIVIPMTTLPSGIDTCCNLAVCRLHAYVCMTQLISGCLQMQLNNSDT